MVIDVGAVVALCDGAGGGFIELAGSLTLQGEIVLQQPVEPLLDVV